MFTIKFYCGRGHRQIIEEADSFTILRDQCGGAEITLHRKNGDDVRRDICDDGSIPGAEFGYSGPPRFARAIIENSAGRTTEIISFVPGPAASKPKIELPRAAA